jgi:basic membrane lipoprotein Med (substrate-binding protein (PBP1-ABC) superfamily)
MNYLKADGFDGAIIGVDANVERIVYDKHKMIEILISQGWEHDDALEHLEYNVWCAYVGENTPIYVDVMGIKEINDL